jgi:hypothetical protein
VKIENKKVTETTPSDAMTSVSRGINRRQMVRRLATAVAAGAALPGVAAAHPAETHPATAATHPAATPEDPAPAQPASKVENSTLQFFDLHQYETFNVLAERIVPGSTEAQVARFVDLLLSVDTREQQQKFLNSLSAFEAYSIQNFPHPFKDLAEDQQNHVLTVASTAVSGHPTPNSAASTLPGAPEGNEHRLTLRDHFENLKEWVARAYFSSELGMKSMGWTGQVMWTSFPGCQQSRRPAKS